MGGTTNADPTRRHTDEEIHMGKGGTGSNRRNRLEMPTKVTTGCCCGRVFLLFERLRAIMLYV